MSYGPAPTAVDAWDVLAVRGPLTAAAIGLPGAAATDGAYLISDAPRLVGPEQSRTDIVFIPHYRNLLGQPWERACEEAGLTFVSPESSVDEMLDRLARASLVVTEAMHGAIVADALRIPWVPVTISPLVDEFKWRDWLSSVELDYAPIPVPPPDQREVRRYERVKATLRRLGIDGHRHLAYSDPTPQDLTDWLRRRYGPAVLAEIHRAEVGTLGDRVVAKALSGRSSSSSFAETVHALQRAARADPVLSTDAVHAARLDQLRSAVGTMTTSILAG